MDLFDSCRCRILDHGLHLGIQVEPLRPQVMHVLLLATAVSQALSTRPMGLRVVHAKPLEACSRHLVRVVHALLCQ